MASKTDSMAAFVDGLMMKGMTVERLFKLAAAESEKRGIRRFTIRAKLERHINNRTRSDRFKVERNGDNIKMTAVAQPAKPKAKAEKAAKPAKGKAKKTAAQREAAGLPPIVKRKTGKATGRKVTKVKENGRQQVVEAPAEPKPEQTAEAA